MLIELAKEPPQGDLHVDLCIIGAGPAGICIAAEFSGGSHSVAVLEAGHLEPDWASQMLNLGRSRGPIIRDHPFYLSTSRFRGLGGSQNAWGGWCTPLLDLDLERRDWVPNSGWPLSWSQLLPYYQRAASACGLHVSVAQSMPERPVAGGEVTERLYGFAPRQRTARAIFEQTLASAPELSVYLGANVTELVSSPSRTRIQGVRARSFNGAELSVTARYYILAAGGVENARLLLANEIGNGNDLVGRFFMEHPHVIVGFARLPCKSTWKRYLERIDPELKHATLTAFGLTAAAQRNHQLLNATVQLWPDETVSQAKDDDTFYARLLLRAEQCPNPKSRLTLGDELDEMGVPVAHLNWDLTPKDWESVYRTAELVTEALVRHAGADIELVISRDSAWPPIPENTDHYQGWGCHHSGATRMSGHPSLGVVDPNTRVHGTANLFVAGSSIFPTEGYANPTLTLIALALRTADYLKEIL
jgi:choline dehydrogenase-like flavoprotein